VYVYYVSQGKIIDKVKCRIVDVVNIGDLSINEVLENILPKYLEFSGFSNCNDWWVSTISHYRRKPKYLVILEKLKR